MLYEGSFWVLRARNCFDKTGMGFLSLNEEASDLQNLEILFRQEYKNISENCILTRLLLERYSDNQIAIFISTRLLHTTSSLFSHLCQHFAGAVTIGDVRGPIILNAILRGDEFDRANFNNVLNLIDQFEQIQPMYIREKLAELTKQEEPVEH